MKKRRKHSKIDALPMNLKSSVEQMIQSNYTYKEIAKYIKDNGFNISVSSVHRHAKSLNASIESMQMAQENFKVIMEEISKYPQLDTTEGIIRLLSFHVMEAINNLDEESLKSVDPMDLITKASALIKASAYKNHIDIKNKDMIDAGIEGVQKLVFESMAKERPELFDEVNKFLNSKKEGV